MFVSSTLFYAQCPNPRKPKEQIRACKNCVLTVDSEIKRNETETQACASENQSYVHLEKSISTIENPEEDFDFQENILDTISLEKVGSQQVSLNTSTIMQRPSDNLHSDNVSECSLLSLPEGVRVDSDGDEEFPSFLRDSSRGTVNENATCHSLRGTESGIRECVSHNSSLNIKAHDFETETKNQPSAWYIAGSVGAGIAGLAFLFWATKKANSKKPTLVKNFFLDPMNGTDSLFDRDQLYASPTSICCYIPISLLFNELKQETLLLNHSIAKLTKQSHYDRLESSCQNSVIIGPLSNKPYLNYLPFLMLQKLLSIQFATKLVHKDCLPCISREHVRLFDHQTKHFQQEKRPCTTLYEHIKSKEPKFVPSSPCLWDTFGVNFEWSVSQEHEILSNWEFPAILSEDAFYLPELIEIVCTE